MSRLQPTRALLELAVGTALALLALVMVFIKVPRKHDPHEAVVEFVPPTATPVGAVVYDSTFTWKLQGQFYITAPFEIHAGDYLAVAAAGITFWASRESKTAAERGYEQVSPNGAPWTPHQLKSSTAAENFPAKDASVGSLIGVVGSQPTYDKTGIPHVIGGSDYFPIRSKSCWRVSKLPAGRHFLSMAINDWWNQGEMDDNVGTWYIKVQVFRIGGKPIRAKP